MMVDTTGWTREQHLEADKQTPDWFGRNVLGLDRAATLTEIFLYGMEVGRGEKPYIKFREYSTCYFIMQNGSAIGELLVKDPEDIERLHDYWISED